MANISPAKDGLQPDGASIRIVLAPNPSMMTHSGTNTYIVGKGNVAVIDPGPAILGHQQAILAALLPGETISHIFVTHSHLDHSGLAPGLSKATGAPVLGFGAATAGRSTAMRQLAAKLEIGGGEGVDHGFAPDVTLPDGATVTAETWALKAIHTPGHMGNHLCFASGTTLFSGDHVMGWSTSLISPPDGDMTDYMAGLQALAAQPWRMFLPGHGPVITNPAQRLAYLAAHRRVREASIIAALHAGRTGLVQLTREVYDGLDARLLQAAARNVLAHLIDLDGRSLILAAPYPGPEAMFSMR